MKATLEAVFEDGVFKPMASPELDEGQRVRITVERLEQAPPDELLRLAVQVYQGLSPEDVEDIESDARNRDFFGARPRRPKGLVPYWTPTLFPL